MLRENADEHCTRMLSCQTHFLSCRRTKKKLPSEGTKRKAEPDGVPATKRKKSTANEAAAEEVSARHSGSYLR